MDVTGQILSNALIPAYLQFIRVWNASTRSAEQVNATGTELVSVIDDLDYVLSTNKVFSLSSWLNATRAWANANYCNDVHNSMVLSAQYFQYAHAERGVSIS